MSPNDHTWNCDCHQGATWTDGDPRCSRQFANCTTMRVLDEGLIAKILKHDISTSTVLYFFRMGIGFTEYDGSVAENIILIDASHNCLKSIYALWKTLCPSAWWINASFNQITHALVNTSRYGLFNSDFLSDSVNTLQSWSTIGPNTCPDIRQDWGTRVDRKSVV